MYRIAIVTDSEKKGREYADRLLRFCKEMHVFPEIEIYGEQESFFKNLNYMRPTSALIALSGVAGLNVAEHFRSVRPECGIIWCSDLDFSLQAFRLRIEYFFREPIDEKTFSDGLAVWFFRRQMNAEREH